MKRAIIIAPGGHVEPLIVGADFRHISELEELQRAVSELKMPEFTVNWEVRVHGTTDVDVETKEDAAEAAEYAASLTDINEMIGPIEVKNVTFFQNSPEDEGRGIDHDHSHPPEPDDVDLGIDSERMR